MSIRPAKTTPTAATAAEASSTGDGSNLTGPDLPHSENNQEVRGQKGQKTVQGNQRPQGDTSLPTRVRQSVRLAVLTVLESSGN